MSITLQKLGDIIKNKLPNTNYIIKGEISRPKIYPSGHMYFTLKDDTYNISCKLWKSNMTNDIKKLENGDLIEVNAKLDFYSERGEISLIISQIKKLDNIGDLHAMFETMKIEFKKLGYFDKKIKINDCIKNIAVLTSLNGAAIHDFMYALENSKSLISVDKINVIVQGDGCPKEIINYLNKNDMSKYDMVVITRGGGSMEDLWGFNNNDLIECVYHRTYPVLSAIGHMVDTTLLDFAADISAPTPSLAAQYLIDHNIKYLDNIKETKNKLLYALTNHINKQVNILDRIKNDNNSKLKESLKNKMESMKNNINDIIKSNLNKLELMIIKMDNNLFISDMNDNVLEFNDFNNIIHHNKKFKLSWNGLSIIIDTYHNYHN